MTPGACESMCVYLELDPRCDRCPKGGGRGRGANLNFTAVVRDSTARALQADGFVFFSFPLLLLPFFGCMLYPTFVVIKFL